MKFEVYYPTGNEFCIQCGELIKTPYIKLNQNMWAKPKLCLKCLKEFVELIETGKVEERTKKVIVYEPKSISKNSWMQLY